MHTGTVLRAFLLLVALASSGEACAIFRAYLASTGSDANPCTLTQPCRLLPAALAAAEDGGEVWMMDSANFNTGTVTIAKSVSVLAIPGAVGSIVGVGNAAIVIDAPASAVKLRNLVIRRLGGSSPTGILVAGVDQLLIEGVTLESLGKGLSVTGRAAIAVRDSTFNSNVIGIELVHQAGTLLGLTVEGTVLFENRLTFIATTANTTGLVRVTIDRSVLDGPTDTTSGGSVVFSGDVPGAAPIVASIARSQIIGRSVTPDFGVSSAGLNTTVTLADCHFSGFPARYATTRDNGNGPGRLRSYGNNTAAEGAMLGHTTVAPQ